MGLEIKVIGRGKKAAQLLVESDNNWTSAITVQAGHRVNIGIRVSDAISDILSAAAFSAAISGINSFFSGIITLQRRMPEENEDYHWRDVAEWTISSAAVGEGGSENITTSPEPETAEYRAGTGKHADDYVGGVAHVRIGTT